MFSFRPSFRRKRLIAQQDYSSSLERMIILYLMQKRSSDRDRGSENQSPDDVIIQEISVLPDGHRFVDFQLSRKA